LNLNRLKKAHAQDDEASNQRCFFVFHSNAALAAFVSRLAALDKVCWDFALSQ
jgi:hypothetical protein